MKPLISIFFVACLGAQTVNPPAGGGGGAPSGAAGGSLAGTYPNPTIGTLGQDLLFTDATYDIGKSGTTRPRDIFLSRDLNVGGTVSIGTAFSGSDSFWGDATVRLSVDRTVTGNPGATTSLGIINNMLVNPSVNNTSNVGLTSYIRMDPANAQSGTYMQGMWLEVDVDGSGLSSTAGGLVVGLQDFGTNVGTHGSLASAFYGDAEHKGLGTVPTVNTYLGFAGSAGAGSKTVTNATVYMASYPPVAATGGGIVTYKAFSSLDFNVSGIGTGYGFWTDASAGANMWAFYGAGTAASHFGGALDAVSYATGTNCADSAGAAACGSAAAGAVVIDAAATTTVVSTTAVTANSEITLLFDASLGSRLSVTCNTVNSLPYVSARTAGTSFTIKTDVAPITNPACISYSLVN